MKKSSLRDVFFYLKKSITFFDLKAKSVPPAVFVGILALNILYIFMLQLDITGNDLLSEYMSGDGAASAIRTSNLALAAGLIIMLVINLLSFIYLDAAIRDAKGMEYTARDSVNAVLKNFLRLTGVTILKNVIFVAGFFMFILPAIFMMVILIFAECVVLDQGGAVVESLKRSNVLTNKKRGEIFKVILFCNLILAFFVIFLLSVFASYNVSVFQYISIFAFSLCILINFKLVAYLYADVMSAGGTDGIRAGSGDPDGPDDTNSSSGFGNSGGSDKSSGVDETDDRLP